MRIATWNVWHRFGEYPHRAAATTEILKEVAADVVCLQEVWTEPATGRSQAGDLRAALGLDASDDAHLVEHEGFTFGNAILSAWPIVRSEVRPLPPHPDYEEYRNVLAAELDHPEGPVQVFTTHLNFLLHQSAVRQVQVQAVGQMMLEWQHDRAAYPQILTGDLNADPASDEIRMLTGRADLGVPLTLLDAWSFRQDDEPGATWSRRNPLTRASYEPDRRIDYIMVQHARQFGGRGAVQSVFLFGDEPVQGTWASDHLGVAVDLAD